MVKTGVLNKYKDLLPITSKTPLFSLGEGDTPLVRCDQLAREIGCGELYFKLEGCDFSLRHDDNRGKVAVGGVGGSGGAGIAGGSAHDGLALLFQRLGHRLLEGF